MIGITGSFFGVRGGGRWGERKLIRALTIGNLHYQCETMLVIQCNITTIFFVATPKGHVIRFNVKALRENDYYIVGLMLATIILRGGEPPNIFSPSICQYITLGLEKYAPTIEEIPNALVRTSLLKVLLCHHSIVVIWTSMITWNTVLLVDSSLVLKLVMHYLLPVQSNCFITIWESTVIF